MERKRYLEIYIGGLLLYVVPYYVGNHWNSAKINGKTVGIGFALMMIAVAVRLFGRAVADETTLYDVFIVCSIRMPF